MPSTNLLCDLLVRCFKNDQSLTEWKCELGSPELNNFIQEAYSIFLCNLLHKVKNWHWRNIYPDLRGEETSAWKTLPLVLHRNVLDVFWDGRFLDCQRVLNGKYFTLKDAKCWVKSKHRFLQIPVNAKKF